MKTIDTVAVSDLAQLTDAPPAPHGGNFIVRHWRGELSLPVSYWVISIGAGLLAMLLGALFDQAMHEQDFTPSVAAAAFLGFMGVLFAITAWQLVGIWRSAGRHYHTKSKFWGALARVAVVLGVLQFSSQIFLYGPIMAQSLRLAFLPDDIPPYRLKLLRAGTEVELSGGMPAGTADALKIVLDAAPTIRVVHLNNIGGFLDEGYKIKKLIAERGLPTYTSTICVSACTVAFLGGVSRYLSSDGRLGFHSARFGSLDGSSYLDLNSGMAASLREQGTPDWFIKKAFGTSSSDMWYPTREELVSAGILTEIAGANQ